METMNGEIRDMDKTITQESGQPFSRTYKSITTISEDIKDRNECFDEYFPCRIKNCSLKLVWNWLRFFVDYHNKDINPVK